jgi:hypothetical protein
LVPPLIYMFDLSLSKIFFVVKHKVPVPIPIPLPLANNQDTIPLLHTIFVGNL